MKADEANRRDGPDLASAGRGSGLVAGSAGFASSLDEGSCRRSANGGTCALMRSFTSSKWLCSALAAAAIIAAAPRPAVAEEAIALDRFHPSFAGDRMFGVPSPFAAGNPGLHVMLLGDYAHNPLVVRRVNSRERVGA